MLRQRPLFVLLSSLIVSYAAAFFLPIEIIVFGICLFLIAAFVFAFFRNLRLFAGLVFLPSALALINFLLFYHFAYRPMVRFEGQKIEVQGEIISEIKSGTSSDYFTVRPTYIITEEEVYEPMGDVVVYADRGSITYPVGSTVSCYGSAFENDEDDYSINYRIAEGRFLSMYASKSNLLRSSDSFNINAFLNAARKKILARYESVFSEDAAALIGGITLGQTENVDDRVYRNFKDSGVSHALAVSGMHLAFVTTILWFVLSLLGKNLYVRALLQIALIWSFTALTGFSPSCCRAAIMLTVFQLGIFLQRESDPLTAHAFAVMVCCLRNPFSVMNPSLVLSATATLGILLLTDKIAALFPPLRIGRGVLGGLYSIVKNTVAMSVAATLGTLPAMIFMFRAVSLLAPITNVLIVIVVEVLFFLGFFAIVFGWIHPVAVCLSWIADVLYGYCDAVTSAVAGLPFCTISTESAAFWIGILLVGSCMTVLWLLLHKKHPYLLTLCFVVVFVCLIGCSYLTGYINRDKIWVDFVDVEQGNAVVVSREHRAILFDCGGSGPGYQEIQHCLTRRGVREISTIYITHLDMDHIKYLEPLLSAYSVEELYLPYREKFDKNGEHILSVAKACSTIVRTVDRDFRFDLDGLRLDILNGHVDLSEDNENQNSLIYQLSYGPTEILLTGDVELDGEKRFLKKYGERIDSDIVMIAHHGSDGGSSEDLLECVDAEVGVISVGKDNQYGLPDPDALKRIKKHIPIIKRTDLDGTVSIQLSPKRYKIEGMK